MRTSKNVLAGFLLVYSVISNAQKIATFVVDLPGTANVIEVPVSVDLRTLSNVDGALRLIETTGGKSVPVPFQISSDRQQLYWVIKPGENKRVFELLKGRTPFFSLVEGTKDKGALTIRTGNQNLLRYAFQTVYPPAGIDTAFKRSAFIHPLWTPHGQELTRIQAPDHYHHYGIWNPWTHVLFEGDTVDFWNLKDRKGTVRFAKFISEANGQVYSEFTVQHDHVAFKKDGKEKTALNELQTVRVYRSENGADHYIVDVTIAMKCASQSPFQILTYRYGGLGWRATEKWKKDNSEVLTSESKTRKDADGSTARWFFVQGSLDNDYGGLAWLSSPENYNHPEPLRIWPEDSNKGEMFSMFAPTKNKDWVLQPGQSYILKYRFVVFNGHFTKEKAEDAWQRYAVKPKIEIQK
ncbi:hypothetical protein WSM22_37320 [Cytophagales bacterium WSM2-2]|nr:hypothetical protein WSM22_37320 [Cytophagales bacterium WSM2-2]